MRLFKRKDTVKKKAVYNLHLIKLWIFETHLSLNYRLWLKAKRGHAFCVTIEGEEDVSTESKVRIQIVKHKRGTWSQLDGQIFTNCFDVFEGLHWYILSLVNTERKIPLRQKKKGYRERLSKYSTITDKWLKSLLPGCWGGGCVAMNTKFP